MKKSVFLIAFLLMGFFGMSQNERPYIIKYKTQSDTIYHHTQSVSDIHIDANGQELIHENGTDWSSLTDLDTVYVYRGCFRIRQDDLQNWDFGSISPNNNVFLVKEEDEDDGFSHVLILMHQTEDTLSFTYQNDTLTDFYYNSYHFMVCEMDTMLLFTTIDCDMAVSYAIPSNEHIAKHNTKGVVTTLLYFTEQIINEIFNADSELNMLVDIENGDRESLMHDLIEMGIESALTYWGGPIGAGVVLTYELYKHYINNLHNKALQFHLGNSFCTIQSIQQNESTNMVDVTISIINGEDIPDDYIWMNYWGQQIASPNYVYYGVLCRAGNYFPTIQKCDYYGKGLLEPHASMTQTFSFPVMAVEKVLFRPFLGFNYEYHNTSLQNGYKKVSLARYGNVVEFYPEFEIITIASPTEAGTVTEGGRYPFNTQITLTATANDGYEFAHWEDGSELNPRVITVEGDSTYTAYFEEQPVELPSVSTYEVTNITTDYAMATGEVTDEGGGTVSERGICLDTEHNPSIEGNHVANGAGLGLFMVAMSNLTENTTYYVRAYATNEAGTAYGEEVTFTTLTTPTVTTAAVTNIAEHTATGGGTVVNDNGSPVLVRGICWSTSHYPTTSDSHATNGDGIGSFTVNMTGLTAHTTYYVRAYATNSVGTEYGDEVTFTTLTTPTVTTAAVTNIGEHTATGGGNVTDDGGSPITVRGICWGTSHNPTTSNSHATSGSGTGSFSVNMTGLAAHTTYYVRAYATNSVGTEYGNEVSFTTSEEPTGDWVDLGLPSGLLWATRNVGASSPEDYGSYFAWAETSPKSEYSERTYQYCVYSNDFYFMGWTKYCNNPDGGYNGYSDTLTVLLPEDDAATVNWGNGWRMPTDEEWIELLYSCTRYVTTQNGVNGMCFIGPNGNTLFLPAAGYHEYIGDPEEDFFDAGDGCFYWGCDKPLHNQTYPCYFFLNVGYSFNFFSYSFAGRTSGFSVRAVRSARQN